MKIYVLTDENRKGPFTTDELRKQLLAGGVKRTSLVWHSGLSEWTPLEEISLSIDAGEVEPERGDPVYQMPPPPAVTRYRRRKVYRVKERSPRPFRDWLFRFLKVAR